MTRAVPASGRFPSPRTPAHLAIHGALCAMVIGLAGSPDRAALADETTQAAAVQSYDLPAGPLGRTLSSLAADTGMALSFDPALTEGRTSPALRGRYTPQEAATRLLSGSGLELVARPDGSHTLRKVPLKARQADLSGALPEVIVTAPAATHAAPGGSARGYVARRSTTATKTDTPIIDTPRAISVVTREQMTAQGVQTVEQALRYTAGINTETNGLDTRHEAMVARGFDTGPVYVDGLRTFKTGSYGDWIAEQQGLDSVELIKGPASVLYGQGSPGGLVNLVTKKPSQDAINDVSLSLGNHDRHETGFDVNSKLDDDGHLLFRINGLARDSKTQFDFGKDNRLYIAPSLSWSPSSATKVTVLLDAIQDRMMPKSWYPATYLTADPALRGPLPAKSLYTGEPGFDHYNRDASSLTYLLTHTANDTWSFSQSARYANYRLDYAHVYASGIDPSSGVVELARNALATRDQSHTFTIDHHAQADFHTGELRHKVLAGLDFQRFSGDEDRAFTDDGDVANLDPYAPAYGSQVTLPPFRHVTSRLSQVGVYAQDQLRWRGLILNAGLRHDQARTRSTNANDTTRTLDQQTTYNLDAMFKTDIGLSPYASLATSFMPNLDTDKDGRAFQPESARQFEVGVKYQPKDSTSVLTASAFELRKKNVTTPDPSDSDFSVQTGEVRSRGLELEGIASLDRQWNLIASYTYLDSRITRSNDPDELNQPFPGTSRQTAKVWLDRKWRGWTLGAGVRHVGKMAAGRDLLDQPYDDPAYTLVDAALHYTQGPVSVGLSAANLFDKVTVVANQFYSQGRTLKATLDYRW